MQLNLKTSPKALVVQERFGEVKSFGLYHQSQHKMREREWILEEETVVSRRKKKKRTCTIQSWQSKRCLLSLSDFLTLSLCSAFFLFLSWVCFLSFILVKLTNFCFLFCFKGIVLLNLLCGTREPLIWLHVEIEMVKCFLVLKWWVSYFGWDKRVMFFCWFKSYSCYWNDGFFFFLFWDSSSLGVALLHNMKWHPILWKSLCNIFNPVFIPFQGFAISFGVEEN